MVVGLQDLSYRLRPTSLSMRGGGWGVGGGEVGGGHAVISITEQNKMIRWSGHILKNDSVSVVGRLNSHSFILLESVNIVPKCFYAKHFESVLCMESAI